MPMYERIVRKNSSAGYLVNKVYLGQAVAAGAKAGLPQPWPKVADDRSAACKALLPERRGSGKKIARPHHKGG